MVKFFGFFHELTLFYHQENESENLAEISFLILIGQTV